jgi:hypothetical protein
MLHLACSQNDELPERTSIERRSFDREETRSWRSGVVRYDSRSIDVLVFRMGGASEPEAGRTVGLVLAV